MKARAYLPILVLAITAGAANAQLQRVRERLVGLSLTPSAMNVEAYYNGSSFAGGGIFQAIGRYEIRENGRRRFENRNISNLVTWTSSREDVFSIQPDWNLFADGLYVYSQDTGNIGVTTITVSYLGRSASSTLTVWAD